MSNRLSTPTTYKQYKIRSLSPNHDKWGITIPKHIAYKFMDVKFTIEIDNEKIILSSGIDIQLLKKEIDKYSLEEI